MDPFTLALATFGIQKLRGKSTRTALQSAALIGGGAFGLGKLGGVEAFQGSPLSSLGFGQKAAMAPKGNLGASFLNKANMPEGTVIGVDKFDNPIISRGGELSGLNVVEPASKTGIAKVIEKAKEKPIQSALLASSVLPLLSEEEEPKPSFTEEDYKQAYKEQAAKLSGAFTPVDTAEAMPTRAEVTGANMFYANQGGLANILPKYNEGGVNYLPSKVDHDENDVNNYVRATGYVEDGAGVGDKDEDTMLAQLADGEFVSRADAVLGAGILSGADPKNFKGMRKAGADFFYNQQKQLKRIYDITNGSKKTN
tara:strand:- start:189 stop:1121 length:933 start_codon:yes stop_codon:yes gene_type:complete